MTPPALAILEREDDARPFATLRPLARPPGRLMPIKKNDEQCDRAEVVPIEPKRKAPSDDELLIIEARWRAEGKMLIGQLPGRKSAAPAVRGRVLPEKPTIVYVMDRLEEAADVISRLPMTIRPRAHANSMPAYAYDRGDLNAQMETGELERMMRVQNKVRIPPSSDQIARAEEAIFWPMLYLKDKPKLARAVQLAALWESRKLDIGKQCRRLKIDPNKEFARNRMTGLRVIVGELMRRGFSVR
jgi:hypothetical protein